VLNLKNTGMNLKYPLTTLTETSCCVAYYCEQCLDVNGKHFEHFQQQIIQHKPLLLRIVLYRQA
jgi:hypothetical protein